MHVPHSNETRSIRLRTEFRVDAERRTRRCPPLLIGATPAHIGIHGLGIMGGIRLHAQAVRQARVARSAAGTRIGTPEARHVLGRDGLAIGIIADRGAERGYRDEKKKMENPAGG